MNYVNCIKKNDILVINAVDGMDRQIEETIIEHDNFSGTVLFWQWI